MQGTLLVFFPVLDRPDLVASTVYEAVSAWQGPQDKSAFLVAEIDPEYAGGMELCERYNVDPACGANCLVVSGTRGKNRTYGSCMVPVGYRYDISGVVRRAMNSRQASVAPLDFVLAESGMEYGSITPVGLPREWLLFIDPLVLRAERIIVGGGLRRSKLSVPSAALLSLPNALVLDGVAKSEG